MMKKGARPKFGYEALHGAPSRSPDHDGRQMKIARRALLLAIPGFSLFPAALVRAKGDPWEAASAILARIKRPRFPLRLFAITRFGAESGKDCTAAIAAAIDAANKAGGGRVEIPAGEWLTGAVHLKSNVELHLAKDAVLKFSRDPAAYLPNVLTRHEGIELMNYSPFIYALDQHDIAVTGDGTLDGQADADYWWAWTRRPPVGIKSDRQRLAEMNEAGVPVAQRVFGAGHRIRPNFIQPYRCRNVLIEGVTIIASPMWEVHPVECANVIVRGLNIHSHGPNNDGCDPESCRDVLIEDCVFDTGDDCIAIKSGRNADGRRLHIPSENVIIRHCRMIDGHGGVTLGSEITGGVRNVFVENCRMDSPRLATALRFKNNAMRGGILENIHVRDVAVGEVANAVITIDYQYQEGANGPYLPVFHTLTIERLTSRKSERVLDLQGFANAPIVDVTLRDCHFNGVAKPDIVDHVRDLRFERVTVNGHPVSAPKSA